MNLFATFLYTLGLASLYYGYSNTEYIQYKLSQASLLFSEIQSMYPNKSKLLHLYQTSDTIIKSWLYAYLNNCNVIEVEKNVFDVFFVIKSKLFKMRVRYMGGPSNILSIKTSDKRELLGKLLPYLGINCNFHRDYQYTPNSFNEKSLTIFYLSDTDGNIHQTTSDEHQPINITL